MTFLKILRKTQQAPQDVKKWRKQPVIVRLKNPTKLNRARALGYKAKPGFAIVRTRIKKGGRKREKPAGGRKPKKAGRVYFTFSQRKQAIIEKRVNKKYKNMEVLNSYKAGEDGQHHYYEVILIDPRHPNIKNKVSAANRRGRAFRGLTSAGRKSRVL